MARSKMKGYFRYTVVNNLPADIVDLDERWRVRRGGAGDEVPQCGCHGGPACISGSDVTRLTRDSCFKTYNLKLEWACKLSNFLPYIMLVLNEHTEPVIIREVKGL
jgi:hypothetical protein